MQPLPIGTFIEAPKKHFEVSPRARTRHTAIFGKSGVGKTTLMRNNILVDIQQGEGVTVLDPHGQLIDEIIEHIPTGRTRDIIYFKPGDLEFVSSINILEKVALPYRPLVVSSIVTTFKNLFPNGWGQQSEYLLTNFCFALIQQNQPKTLLDILKLITDRDYRKRIFENVDDAVLQGFYQKNDGIVIRNPQGNTSNYIFNAKSFSFFNCFNY